MTESEFSALLLNNLTEDILPYWEQNMTDPRGGFYGRRDGYDRLDIEAPKGAILNGRLLWTFSAAYRITGDRRLLRSAERVFDYIAEHFIDREYGGVYWSVNAADGSPLDTRKQFYALAFVLYGMAEFYAAAGRQEALDIAIELFNAIEAHSRDFVKGGYIEAVDREWKPLEDMRLSEKDENMVKTMNTHLHILEAYTRLLSVWPDDRLREATTSLLRIFLDRIIDPATGHLSLFFDEEWNPSSRTISFGHDIEASWLLLECADVIGAPELAARTQAATKRLAEAALEGLLADGAMAYELNPDGDLDTERHWWVQAETVVGLIWLALRHNRAEAMTLARRTWDYISAHLLDRQNGEWFWSRLPNGEVNRRDDKAGFWKCPYHNGRMAIIAAEMLNRYK